METHRVREALREIILDPSHFATRRTTTLTVDEIHELESEMRHLDLMINEFYEVRNLRRPFTEFDLAVAGAVATLKDFASTTTTT
jgi:hypothetical protein